MPIIKSNSLQKKLYAHANENGYIIPACHCFDIHSMKSILMAAEEEQSPIILQIGKPAHDIFEPFTGFFKYLDEYASTLSVPIMLNHDHMQDPEDCIYAIKNGFPSVMFDGSHLPFEENIKLTRYVADFAHEHDAFVEAELGNIPGMEDMVFSANTVYTDPDMSVEFIEKSGCDSLAIAVGTAHGGVDAGGPLKIDYDLLKRIKKAVGDFPLVLHGAASLPKEYIDNINKFGGEVKYLNMVSEPDIAKTKGLGIVKANMDVDNFLVYSASIRKFFLDSPEKYFPIPYLRIAQADMKDAVKHKICNVTCSAGQAPSFIY